MNSVIRLTMTAMLIVCLHAKWPMAYVKTPPNNQKPSPVQLYSFGFIINDNFIPFVYDIVAQAPTDEELALRQAADAKKLKDNPEWVPLPTDKCNLIFYAKPKYLLFRDISEFSEITSLINASEKTEPIFMPILDTKIEHGACSLTQKIKKDSKIEVKSAFAFPINIIENTEDASKSKTKAQTRKGNTVSMQSFTLDDNEKGISSSILVYLNKDNDLVAYSPTYGNKKRTVYDTIKKKKTVTSNTLEIETLMWGNSAFVRWRLFKYDSTSGIKEEWPINFESVFEGVNLIDSDRGSKIKLEMTPGTVYWIILYDAKLKLKFLEFEDPDLKLKEVNYSLSMNLIRSSVTNTNYGSELSDYSFSFFVYDKNRKLNLENANKKYSEWEKLTKEREEHWAKISDLGDIIYRNQHSMFLNRQIINMYNSATSNGKTVKDAEKKANDKALSDNKALQDEINNANAKNSELKKKILEIESKIAIYNLTRKQKIAYRESEPKIKEYKDYSMFKAFGKDFDTKDFYFEKIAFDPDIVYEDLFCSVVDKNDQQISINDSVKRSEAIFGWRLMLKTPPIEKKENASNYLVCGDYNDTYIVHLIYNDFKIPNNTKEFAQYKWPAAKALLI